MTMTQERMNTVGNDETFSDDIRALRKERAKIKNRRDDIVIFPNGDKWFVFGFKWFVNGRFHIQF